MDISLKSFCYEVPNALSPYKSLLDQSSTALGTYHDQSKAAPVKASLAEIQNRLGNLYDRLEGQNTYLLIFGPLKSGKSTLMNAISKGYVSEVTSLPAYPCLVYVKNAATPKYSATAYNGKTEVIEGGGVGLKKRIDAAHLDLGKRLLEVEKGGEEFDPRVHATSAIRRVDIELPAEELGNSGIVLVDTPGLYTRMKFGYGLMTREFRNHAACAVFVVKAENLFFEQVFAEFEDLLKVFSRIFLVVNIDANKKDLAPDGSLKPSVEAAQPTKLIDAFEALAMSVPLSEAYHEGRLKIYTADLLTAAQGRLSDGKAGRKSPEFERFMGDLTEYLHSSDYLLEFMKDSLKQGEAISDETFKLLVTDFGGELEKDRLDLEREERDLNGKLKRIDEVARVNWTKSLGTIGEASQKDMDSVVKTRRAEVERQFEQDIGQWMQSGDSLSALLEGKIRPTLDNALTKTHQEGLEKVRRECSAPLGGAQLAPGDVESFKSLGISLEDMGEALSQNVGKDVKLNRASFAPAAGDLAVKKRFLDYLLFRSRKSVANKLFGGADNSDAGIPPAVKLKRLGPEFQTSLMTQLRGHVGEAFKGVRQGAMTGPVKAYQTAYTNEVREKTKTLDTVLREQRRTVESKMRNVSDVTKHIGKVETASSSLMKSIGKLRSAFLSPDGKTIAKPKTPSQLGSSAPAARAATTVAGTSSRITTSKAADSTGVKTPEQKPASPSSASSASKAPSSSASSFTKPASGKSPSTGPAKSAADKTKPAPSSSPTPLKDKSSVSGSPNPLGSSNPIGTSSTPAKSEPRKPLGESSSSNMPSKSGPSEPVKPAPQKPLGSTSGFTPKSSTLTPESAPPQRSFPTTPAQTPAQTPAGTPPKPADPSGPSSIVEKASNAMKPQGPKTTSPKSIPAKPPSYANPAKSANPSKPADITSKPAETTKPSSTSKLGDTSKTNPPAPTSPPKTPESSTSAFTPKPPPKTTGHSTGALRQDKPTEAKEPYSKPEIAKPIDSKKPLEPKNPLGSTSAFNPRTTPSNAGDASAKPTSNPLKPKSTQTPSDKLKPIDKPDSTKGPASGPIVRPETRDRKDPNYGKRWKPDAQRPKPEDDQK